MRDPDCQCGRACVSEPTSDVHMSVPQMTRGSRDLDRHGDILVGLAIFGADLAASDVLRGGVAGCQIVGQM